MLGTIVNTIAVIVGGIFGVLLRKGIPDGYKVTITQGIGLSAFVIGLSGALKTEEILLMISSIVIGTVVGEALKIEDSLENLGKWLESKVDKNGSGVAIGFVNASLIFCVGAMAITGALESGLTGNHEILFAKSLMDGVYAIIFGSTLGIGVAFSGLSIFIYQGLITVTASFVKPFLLGPVILEMSAIGGLLIMGIALNVLEIKKIRVGNMLPAIVIPVVYYMIQPYINNILNIFGFN